jgi:hypothetical protein
MRTQIGLKEKKPIERLLPLKSRLLKLQGEDGIRMYVYCPWWAKFGGGGPSLWPEQMTALSELNLECTIDFADYSHQGEANAEERHASHGD